MKITIQKREPDKNGHRALRLVYYHGSKTDKNGSRSQKRSYETLDLFLYDKPRLPEEREHNKTVNRHGMDWMIEPSFLPASLTTSTS